MSEDTPLYGEQSASSKMFMYIVQGVLGLFAAFSCIIGIVFGIKRQGQHIMLVAVVIELCVITWLFFRWYMNDSIDPKYRWLVVGLTLTLLWTCITLNAYAWHHKVDPATKCGLGDGYYCFKRKQCLTLSNVKGIADCSARHFCMCITSHTPATKTTPEAFGGVCRNCTSAPCYRPPMPPP